MPIDPDVAIGAELPPVRFAWTAEDVLLYHLALGAGANPVDPRELRYTYEDGLRVLPTFATVAAKPRTFEPPAVQLPGIRCDLTKVLYGRQSVTVHGPIPVAGEGVSHTRIADVLDKGKAAVVIQESTATSLTGSPLWTMRSELFAIGEGGFGGERGATRRVPAPDRGADVVLDSPTLGQQALLYRLCGDRNPLHVDPAFAAAAGFERPILHGLCTYGIVAKAVTDALLDADVTRVRSFTARFAGAVRPGETLRTRVWAEGSRLLLDATVVERDVTVLTDAVLTIGEEPVGRPATLR